jgi:hypothetical protein
MPGAFEPWWQPFQPPRHQVTKIHQELLRPNFMMILINSLNNGKIILKIP